MKTILIVDPCPRIREKLVSAIKNVDFMTLEASNSKEALEIIYMNCIDLIIIELILPQMNGYELMRRIFHDPKTCYIPIIIYSSKDDEFTRYWSLKGSGALAFIGKTDPLENLIQNIQTLIS